MDFNLQRLFLKRMKDAHLWESWEHIVEIEGFAPAADLPMYVKDVSLTPIEITTEARKLGADVFTYPVSAEPVVISMTFRDDSKRTVHNWLDERVKKIVNPDGTWNMMADYVFSAAVFYINEKGEKGPEYGKWDVYPTQVGETRFSVEEHGFLEFPVTFQQGKSLVPMVKNNE